MALLWSDAVHVAASTSFCLLPCREQAASSRRGLTQSAVKVMEEQRTGEEAVGCQGATAPAISVGPWEGKESLLGAGHRVTGGWWGRDKQGHTRLVRSWQKDGKSPSPLLRSAMRTPPSFIYSTTLLAPVQLPNPVCVWVNLSSMIT